jgi:hypothetical protein
MHFNEMSVKSRQFGLAFVAAALGLCILMLSRDQEFAIAARVSGSLRTAPHRRSGRIAKRCLMQRRFDLFAGHSGALERLGRQL